jgi:hypothetical protein
MRDANGKFTAGHQEKLRHGYAVAGRVHPLFRVWAWMIDRCRNPNNSAWKHYGARGIKVCERWQKFENFAEDMEPTYQKGLSIERRNNDRGYSPGNCCWATRTEQIRNRRVTLRAGNQFLKDAATKAGVKYHTVYARRQRGWPQSRWFEPEDGRYKA